MYWHAWLCTAGPISQVRMVPDTGVCLSASYDKSLQAWDVSGARPRPLGLLGSQAAPILEVNSTTYPYYDRPMSDLGSYKATQALRLLGLCVSALSVSFMDTAAADE